MFELGIAMLLLGSGLILVLLGAEWFVNAAVSIARYLKVPQFIVGATIVSITTTLPEAFVSGMSVYRGHTDFAIGNALGSNICNIGLVLGFSLMFATIKIEGNLLKQQGFMMLGAGLFVYLFALPGKLTYPAGFLLISALVAYIIYLATQARQDRSMFSDKATISLAMHAVQDPSPGPKLILPGGGLFLLGAIMLLGGSRLVLDGSIRLAQVFGVSELIIALTLISISTSLPELFVGVAALRRKHNHLLLGNIIGANILNIILVIGVSALIRPLPMPQQSLKLDFPIMLLLMVALLSFGLFKKCYTRREGLVFMAIYVTYLITLAGTVFLANEV